MRDNGVTSDASHLLFERTIVSTSIFTRSTGPALLLAATMMALAGNAQAQTQAPAQPGENQKSCQASTNSADGKARDANLDGTYSACSLADGFISGSTRANDGKKPVPEFNGVMSDQELRKFDSSDGTHRLAINALPGKETTVPGGTVLSADDNSFRFRTRDFVAVEEIYPLDDTAAYGAAGRAVSRSSAASLGESAPLSTGGVGGGAAAGDLNTNGGLVPAVPEPGTWAMLLAGLGLLALAGRRKLTAKT